jgi:hypothetical protein
LSECRKTLTREKVVAVGFRRFVILSDTLKITLQMYLKMKKKRVGKIKYDKTIYIDYILYIYYSVYPYSITFGVLSEFCHRL